MAAFRVGTTHRERDVEPIPGDARSITWTCSVTSCLTPAVLLDRDPMYPLCGEHAAERRAQMLGWES